MIKAEIKIRTLQKETAEAKAKAVETIANNLDLDVLKILAEKSGKPGMNDTVRQFQHML